jgi:hypothetical protein
MKKIILTLLITVPLSLLSQISISCEGFKACSWNTYLGEFDDCKYNEDFKCLFKISNNATVFNHITPTMSSTYYVESSYKEDDIDIATFYVVSDAGNKYTFYIDYGRRLVKILGSDYILIYTIKTTY